MGGLFYSLSKSQNVLAIPSLVCVDGGHLEDPHEVSIIEKENVVDFI